MEIIKHTWQGLVSKNGEICEGCNKTYLNIENALTKLEPLISNFGIKIILEKKELSEEDLKKDPMSSNRIFINGEPIEEILNLEAGKGTPCKLYNGFKCRTIIDGDKETNEIPEKLIIAALFTKIKEIF